MFMKTLARGAFEKKLDTQKYFAIEHKSYCIEEGLQMSSLQGGENNKYAKTNIPTSFSNIVHVS